MDSFNRHVSDKKWTTRTQGMRGHTQFQNTEEFMHAVGGAGKKSSVGSSRGRGGDGGSRGPGGGRGAAATSERERGGGRERKQTRRAVESEDDSEDSEDSGRDEQDGDDEEIDFKQLAAPADPEFVGQVAEQRRKAVFGYSARCLHCPINYEPKNVSAFVANNFERLAESLDLAKADLRGELRTAKRTGKMLLSELEQRLASLDEHPFYTPKSFETREGYETWKDTEKSRIKKNIQKMKGIPTYSGSLCIRVMRAKNLSMKDDEPQPVNAYCFMTLRGEEKQTSVIQKEPNPDWGEDFTYTINSEEDVLRVEVWQKQIIGSTFLGAIDIPVSEIPEHQKEMKWHQLKQKGGGKDVTGQLRLSLLLVGREGLSAESGKPTESDSYTSNSNHNENYKILLHYLYANDVKPMSSSSKDGEVEVEKWEAVKKIDSAKPRRREVIDDSGEGDRRQRLEELKREKLSDISKWLLSEYQERYGIGSFYAPLALIEMLVRPFRLTTARLDFLYEVLIEFRITESTEPLPMNIPEKKLVAELNDELKRTLVACLKHYNAAFNPENVSKGALSTVIVIVSHLTGVDSEQMCDQLTGYIKFAVRENYESYKDMAGKEPFEKKLSVACGFIPAAISSDISTFGDEFPKELKLSELLPELYYQCLSKDVVGFYAGDVPLSAHTFDLFFHLNSLHDLVGHSVNKNSLLDLGDIFSKFVQPWITNFIEQFKHWNKDSIAQDDWTPLQPPSEGQEAAMLHSVSVADLFTAFNEFEKFFAKLTVIRTPEHTKAFAMALSVIVRDYVTRIRVLNFEDLSAASDRLSDTHDFTQYLKLSKEMKKKMSKTEALTIKPALCIRINNIDNIAEQLERFANKFDKAQGNAKEQGLASLLDETLDWLHDAKQEILDAVVTKVDVAIRLALELSQQKKKKKKDTEESDDEEDPDAIEAEARIEPLIAYLRTQLITLSDNLYFPVFQSLLAGVWAVVLKDIELVVVPPADEVLDKTVHCDENYVEQVPVFIELLADFFHANGVGLSDELLGDGEESLNKVLDLFKESTPNLIKIFSKLETVSEPINQKEGEYDSAPIIEEAILSVLAQRKGDKEAAKFAKANKTAAQNRALARYFELPKTEVQIEKRRCCNTKLCSGWLYVTTSHLCFDSFFGGALVVIKIEDIRDLAKKPVGINDIGLKIGVKTGKTYTFSGWDSSSRSAIYKALLKQAEKLDCILGQQVRDGVLKHDDADNDEVAPLRGSGSSIRGEANADPRKVKRSSTLFGKMKKHVRTPSKMAAAASQESLSDSEDSDKGSDIGLSAVLDTAPLLQRRVPTEDKTGSGPSTPTETKKTGKGHKRGASVSVASKRESTAELPKSAPQAAATTPVDASAAIAEGGEKKKFTVTHTGGAAAPGSPAVGKRAHKRSSSTTSAKKEEEKEKKKKEKKPKEKKEKKGSLRKSKQPESEDKKASKLANRTKKLRKRFGLGENSRFIDKFDCSHVGGGSLAKGTFYVANTHLCFFSNFLISNTKIAIPFSLIKEVKKVQTPSGKHEAIELVTEQQNFDFRAFDDIDAVFELVSKGWKTRTGTK